MRCGYAVAGCGWLPLDSIPGLNTFVLYFALPCMLLCFGAVTPIARMADAGRIARIVLVSTGLAFLSFSAAVALFV